jgi:hypothetical protein
VNSIEDNSKLRKSAIECAPLDYRGALKLARQINEPWSRCQTLAHAARYCTEAQERSEILAESFAAAETLCEPNRVVSCSSWPLAVYAAWNEIDELDYTLELLLRKIAKEPSPVRRADALEVLLRALANGPDNYFFKVFVAYAESCLTPLRNGKRNKKGQSGLVTWIGYAWRIDPKFAASVLIKIEGPEHRNRALKNLEYARELSNELYSWTETFFSQAVL